MSEARHSFALIPLRTFTGIERPLGRGIWAMEFRKPGIGMSEARHSFALIPLPILTCVESPLGRGIWAREFRKPRIGTSEARPSFALIPLRTFAGVECQFRQGNLGKGISETWDWHERSAAFLCPDSFAYFYRR
jgi:hypothetical protein